MDSRKFVAVCFSDLAGQVRGHGVPQTGLNDLFRNGLPWPNELAALTAFGEAVETPWDCGAGLRVLPDPNAEVTIDFGADGQLESFVLGSLQTADERHWGGCTRSFLQMTLDRLKSEFGLDLSCGYEHQFSFLRDGLTQSPPMSLTGLRRERRFASTLSMALENAAITLVRFGAGAGAGQFAATTKAKFGVAAADSAVIFRQLVHASAEHLGQRCSFAPAASSPASPNKVVLGIDLFADGDQVTYDSTAPDGISATLGSFVGGITQHLPALTALTRPSIVPNETGEADTHSTPGVANAAQRLGRPVVINPGLCTTPANARGYSFTVTTADATACPYLQLGAIVCAGILGLRAKLNAPGLQNGNGSGAGANLPGDLPAALAALAEDEVFASVFPDGLLEAYCGVKRAELEAAARWSPTALREWSKEIY